MCRLPPHTRFPLLAPTYPGLFFGSLKHYPGLVLTILRYQALLLLSLYRHLTQFGLQELPLILLYELCVGLLPILNDTFSCLLDVFPVLFLAGIDFSMLEILLNLLYKLEHVAALATIRSDDSNAFAYFVEVYLTGEPLSLFLLLNDLDFMVGFLEAHALERLSELLVIST